MITKDKCLRTAGFGLQEVGLDSAGCLSACRMLSNKQLHDLKKRSNYRRCGLVVEGEIWDSGLYAF